MKNTLLLAVLALAVAAPVPRSRGADPVPLTNELRILVDGVRMNVANGRKTQPDLAEQLREFDALLEKHKNEKTDDVAQVLLMKAMVYIQVLDQADNGIALVQQLKADFPETAQGKNADKILENIRQQTKARKIRKALGPGAVFPDFQEKDLQGNDLSLAKYKGKIVLINFWASWCPPCRRELPYLLKAYESRHKDGLEIIGVSLDEDQQRLEKFLKDNTVPWPQYFDKKRWENKLALRFGVDSIPATYLLDREGRIIARDLRGSDLEEALADALAGK